MVKFKLCISSKGKAYTNELNEEVSTSLLGKKLSDKIDGSLFGFKDYEFIINGGSDFAGFPMRKDIHGTKRQSVLLTKGPGFKPKGKVYKRRKTLRGNTIAEDIIQINLIISKQGPKPLNEYFKPAEQSSGAPGQKSSAKEEKTEEKKE